ncbi:hypothetical protein AK830_g1767 [Neonectria ditissima]|uniref:Uncharacterized protein n=1 Tax=Neonectria ditissima TaxID=78410 RepID=A0A0P7BTS1_9HYPO|nr:hypothetical protein AK830_g1767 [Neonectria ditissima]
MSTPYPDTFSGSSFGAYVSPVVALFLSSLGAPNVTTLSSLDTWGNIKVPMLDVLPDFQGSASKDWIPINTFENGTDIPTYSSLIGIPVAGIPENQNSTFTLETSYLNLECADLQYVQNYTAKREQIRDGAECASNGNKTCVNTMTWGDIGTIPYPEGWTNDSLSRCYDPSPNEREIIYLDWNSITNSTFAKCTAQTVYVEVKVECVGWDCVSVAMRPSSLETNPSPNNTYFDRQCDRASNVFGSFMSLFNQATRMQTSSSVGPSTVQGYIYDPYTVFNTTGLYYQPGLWSMDKKRFSIRLSQLLNTYWLAAAARNALFLGHPSSYNSLMPFIESGAMDTMYFSASNVTIATAVVRIHTDYGWLVPLVISTLLMWTASMVSMAVDLQLGIPKMLLNLTPMTRGNPNFNLPPGGGGLTDETRGKLIRDLKVRFGRVEGNDPDDLVVGSCIESGGTVSVARKRNPFIQDNVI